MKLKREAYRTYIRFGSTGQWYLIGKGIDDMSVEMNGSFEQTKDITGETTTSDSGYQPQISVEPYRADPDDAIYEKLRDISMNRKSGDDAKAEYLEVIIEDTADTKHKAWKEDCRVEISSYGGDTTGFGINFNIWADGNREEGEVTYSDRVPTFTAKTTTASGSDS